MCGKHVLRSRQPLVLSQWILRSAERPKAGGPTPVLCITGVGGEPALSVVEGRSAHTPFRTRLTK